jgi:hypothetical protein
MRATRPLLPGHGFPGNRPSNAFGPYPCPPMDPPPSELLHQPTVDFDGCTGSVTICGPPSLGPVPVRVWHASPSLTVTLRLDYLLLSSTFFLPSLSPSELPSYTYLSSNNIVISLANRLPRATIYGCYGITALILKRIGIGRALVPI